MTQINIRVDEGELEKWKLRAGHHGVSAWLRELANHECGGVTAKLKTPQKKLSAKADYEKHFEEEPKKLGDAFSKLGGPKFDLTKSQLK